MICPFCNDGNVLIPDVSHKDGGDETIVVRCTRGRYLSQTRRIPGFPPVERRIKCVNRCAHRCRREQSA